MHWTDRRKAKANLGAALERKGWTLYGWKEDRSDSMTDYYDPESWAGIATLGDAVAVCTGYANGATHTDSGREIMQRQEIDEGECPHCKGTGDDPSGWTLAKARENPREYNAFSAGPGCVTMFPEIVSPIPFRSGGALRCRGPRCDGGRIVRYETIVTGRWPAVQATPKGRVWHVERGGKILASGVGLKALASYSTGPAAADLLAEKITKAAQGRAGGAPVPAPVSEVTVRMNPDKSGVEIHFPDKPEAEILAQLKARGWRWSRFSKCWYKRDSEAARNEAAEIAGNAEGAEATA